MGRKFENCWGQSLFDMRLACFMFNFAFVIISYLLCLYFFTLLICGVIRVTSCLSFLVYPPWGQKLFKVLLVEYAPQEYFIWIQSKLSLVMTLSRQEVHCLLTSFNWNCDNYFVCVNLLFICLSKVIAKLLDGHNCTWCQTS